MLLIYFGSSFVLHLLWENAQAPLFDGYISFAQHFPICFKATATGDMFAVALIYLTLTIIHRDLWWIFKREIYQHPATWVIPILLGVFVALVIELLAVYVDHRWVYSTAMPLLPLFKVGFTPVLQMIVVPLTVLLLSWWRAKSNRRTNSLLPLAFYFLIKNSINKLITGY